LDELVPYSEECGEMPISAELFSKWQPSSPTREEPSAEALELFEEMGDTDGIAAAKRGRN